MVEISDEKIRTKADEPEFDKTEGLLLFITRFQPQNLSVPTNRCMENLRLKEVMTIRVSDMNQIIWSGWSVCRVTKREKKRNSFVSLSKG